jgi:serine/threonine protein kinase
MIDEERLAELLLAWEENFEQGEDVPCDQLCQDSPELAAALAERIATLKQMDWLESKNHQHEPRQKSVQEKKANSAPSRGAAHYIGPGMEPISGYRLIERIGQGAFGEVWSASSDGKTFAIKFFHGELDAPDARGRAEKELEGLTRIKKVDHPSILQIHSLIVRDEKLILVTELADCSLERLFAKLRDEFSMVRRCAYALSLLKDVATALDHLQARYDLLHLDIKPANLLLVNGMCKIGDFGTVFQFQSNQRPSQEMLLTFPSPDNPDKIETLRYGSFIAGSGKSEFRRDATLFTAEGAFTPWYAPPEAFEGKNSRSFDQYSLALTFCDLVGGEIPFKGENQLADRNEGRMEMAFLPEPLREVIGRALASKAVLRFPSCSAFIDSLSEALNPLVENDKRSSSWDSAEPEANWLTSLGNTVAASKNSENVRVSSLPMDKKTVVACPKCARRLYVPTMQGKLRVTCPACREAWDWPESNFDRTFTSSPCQKCLHPLDPWKLLQEPKCPNCGAFCQPSAMSKNIVQSLIAQFATASDSPLTDMNIKQPESPSRKPQSDKPEDKEIITCPKCAQKLSIPSGVGSIEVTCPTCRDVWNWPPETKAFQDTIPESRKDSTVTIHLCKKCLKYLGSSQAHQHSTCPKCGADCSDGGIQEVIPSDELGRVHPKADDVPSNENDKAVVDFPSNTKLKMSDLTVAGWLLLLVSVTAMVSIAFPIAGLVSEYNPLVRDGRLFRILFVVIVSIPSVVAGLLLFFGGKWLLEKRLKIIVIKKWPA